MKHVSSLSLREKLFIIIFKSETLLGRRFDFFLVLMIVMSIMTVMLESVSAIGLKYGNVLSIVEWTFTILFTIEYIVRVAVVPRPMKFIFSFYGVIDLLSCLPAYVVFFTPAGSGLLVIRALRLLRLFRVLKLTRYINAGTLIWDALKASRYKIGIFLYTVLMLIIVIGALMYLIEGEASGFDSIPRSMYWVVVTITTVGYGDIAPQTTVGQLLASIVMILGYAIIAVPTGIVTAEATRLNKEVKKPSLCPKCFEQIVSTEAHYCMRCGEKLSSLSSKG